ncbi:doublecortin domain-containing protein 1 [Sceloporus undulatus]|uniref:doublecortin domain-containing protein 1 n=1 Tax=Sceloporus undulatus TaxID=8520 RepID=UPI001C4B8CE9|nr:doublecortin domain-containing protein 1 [Sceloporus undulatus]
MEGFYSDGTEKMDLEESDCEEMLAQELEDIETESADSAYAFFSESSERNYEVSTPLLSSSEMYINTTRVKKEPTEGKEFFPDQNVCSPKTSWKCMSPYTKTAKKTEEKQSELLFGCRSPLQSSVVSRRSGLQDGTTHQIKSVQKSDRVSELVSYKSNSTNNFCLISPSKRNRPVSVPPGQLRCQPLSSSKFHLAQKAFEVPHSFKWQPQRLRVTAYKNGTVNIFVKVTVPPSIKLLLEECTEKLKLNMAARRVFLADGTEALDAIDIPHDADVYISTGEPFSNPFKKIKDHLLLMKKATWTLNGLAFPRGVSRSQAKPVLSKRMKNLTEKPSIRLLVFKNCMGQDGYEISAPPNEKEKFLDICTIRLNLTLPAKCIYNMHGERIEDLINVPVLDKCLQNSITPLRGPLWVSKGEGFSPSGAKMYIQGVLLALHQRLKSARNYCEQVGSAIDGHKEEITDKRILSMKEEELYLEQEEVNKLIDELQAAIKNYKGHLSKLLPQLQAEQEQCTSYVYQHIKELPANTLLPQGLQLKVYENGKDTGEIIVYISRKEMETNCRNQPSIMLERVQHIIHQRLQCSADFKPSGLSRFPTQLFDETGQEIKNPLSLQNEQKIWVSYGEDYRSPLNPVLSLTFDRVTAAEKNGITVIYKTLLDPTVDLLPGCDNWEACVGFPDNFQLTSPLEHQTLETVDPDSYFMQYKIDPQLVVLGSVTMENMKKSISRRSDLIPASACFPLSNMWMITKTGMILSRAIVQSCLAVGCPIRAVMQDGIPLEGFKLNLQKRDKNNIYQYWTFQNDGCIHSKAYPEFVLTYLEELNVREEVTQTEYHTHHGGQSALHQEADSNIAEEDLKNNVCNCNEKQLSGPLDAHLMPEGPLEGNRQLTVALVRKLKEKHPKASAQRWAIKHEGVSKPGQWKQSKVDNPLWNKLTYMWPVLPNGELNETFEWPIEGLLIPNSPPLKKPAGKMQDSYMPLRLKVLKNGEEDKNKAIFILGLDCSTVMKKQCTTAMKLPFAARRLFTGNGVEIFLLKDLERDELIYVSCGEQWIDPQWTVAQNKKRLQLNNLASDVTAIRAYCVMRNTKNLALEVKKDIAIGAKLSVGIATVDFERKKVVEEPDEKQAEESTEKIKDNTDKCLNSHAKSHLKADACYKAVKYTWQQIPYDFDENCSFLKEKDEQFFEDAELYKKYRYRPKLTEEVEKAHHQLFEFRNGKIINCCFPNLLLGVENSDLHSGAEVVLLEKKGDNINQHWIWREDSRTFHLVNDPTLVLAVSMPNILNGYPKITLEIQGCPVILQKYQGCKNGAANQKWNYIETTKVFTAFYTTILDQEITAANYASICTFSVTNTEKIDQLGYYFLSPCGKEKVMICLACARSLRGKKELKKLSPGTVFFCASGSEGGKHLSMWPYKCLDVTKTDLSTSEAESTLHYLEELLASLRTETSLQMISEKMSAAVNQKAVKIIAYKNGTGYENGQLIVASTFPMLLSLCTRQLEFKRTASKLYTSKGTLILTLQDLVLCAVKDYFRKQEPDERNEGATVIPAPNENVSVFSTKDKMAKEGMNAKSPPSVMTLNDLKLIDDILLTIILRNPIEVWVSSGEPFLPLDTLQKTRKQERQKWLEKDKILADLDAMKHKMRQLQGRRIAKSEAANLVPTKSPFQPVVVEGGWTEETQEEKKLMEMIQHRETHLSELQALQFKRSSPVSPKLLTKDHRGLYKQPATKRVWAYANGSTAEQGAHAWGKTITELLDSCTMQLKMPQPAKILYAPAGERLQTWDEIERDMIVCVSTGQAFMNRKAMKHEVEIRALYARIQKQQGPESTNIIVSPSEKITEKVSMNSSLLALTCRSHSDFTD